MSAPKPAANHDPVIAAFDNAPLDQNALTPEEAADLDAQLAEEEEQLARGERPYRSHDEVAASIAELAYRCRMAFDRLTTLAARNTHPEKRALVAAGTAYAEGRLSIDEVAAVLGIGVPDAVAVLQEPAT